MNRKCNVVLEILFVIKNKMKNEKICFVGDLSPVCWEHIEVVTKRPFEYLSEMVDNAKSKEGP